MAKKNLTINTIHQINRKQLEIHAWQQGMTVNNNLRVVIYSPNRCVADFTLTKQNLLDMLEQLEEESVEEK